MWEQSVGASFGRTCNLLVALGFDHGIFVQDMSKLLRWSLWFLMTESPGRCRSSRPAHTPACAAGRTCS